MLRLRLQRVGPTCQQLRVVCFNLHNRGYGIVVNKEVLPAWGNRFLDKGLLLSQLHDSTPKHCRLSVGVHVRVIDRP